jgi:hypothetical protein
MLLRAHCVDQRLAQPGKIGGDAVHGGRGCVLTSIMLSVISSLIVAEAPSYFEAADQVGGAARQVEIAARQQLQFQFDAQRQRLALT